VFIAINRPREPFNGPFAFTLSFSEKEREKNAVFIQMYTDYALGKISSLFLPFICTFLFSFSKKRKLSNLVV